MKQELIFKILLILLALQHYQCERNKNELPEDIEIKVELEDNIPIVEWNIREPSRFTSLVLRRIHGIKREDANCDSCTLLNRRELNENYEVHSIITILTTDDLEINFFRDSLFPYTDGLFYQVEAINGPTLFVESKYSRLAFPEIHTVPYYPEMVVFVEELNCLYFIENSQTTKLIQYDLNNYSTTSQYDFGFKGADINVCKGIFGGNFKILALLSRQICLFNAENLELDWNFSLDTIDHFNAIASRENNIYIHRAGDPADAYIYRIDYDTKEFRKASDVTVGYSYCIMKILDDQLYTINSVAAIERFEFQSNGNLVKQNQVYFENPSVYDIGVSKEKSLLVLSNGHVLDKNLNPIRTINFKLNTELLCVTGEGEIAAVHVPGTKCVLLYEIESGNVIAHKNLITLPEFIFGGKTHSISIGDTGDGRSGIELLDNSK